MNIRRWFASRLSSLRSLWNRDSDVERELRSHLDLETEEQQESGLSSEDARSAARRAFGSPTLVREDILAIRRFGSLEQFVRDLKYAARSLRKSPAFSIVAVLTLALGIGANTAIFSIIESVLLQPLPFPGADQIVRIYSTKGGSLVGSSSAGRPGGPSPMDVRDFAQSNHTFDAMAVYDTWRKNVSYSDGQAEPQQMIVGLVPGAYFEALGVKPLMGRLFTKDESYIGKYYVAAISSQLWRNQFAADPNILGRKIRINDEPYAIIAVMPDVIPEWTESTAVQIWTPFGFADALGDLWTEVGRGGRGWYTLGRIKSGVSLEQAQADLSTIAAALAAQYPVDRGIGVTLEKLSDTRARNLRPMLFLLTGAVSLILLIACVNLANLLLARNSARERELALRSALGAGRARLIAQLLAETLLLSLTGGLLGFLLARFGVDTLVRLHPANLPQLSSLGLDWRVLLFTLLASLLTALLFGLGPALIGTCL